MFGTPENNNTELRSDSTSGDVSEVESGLEVTESEMDEDLAKEFSRRIQDTRYWCCTKAKSI